MTGVLRVHAEGSKYTTAPVPNPVIALQGI
jgi:hypothetical protein